MHVVTLAHAIMYANKARVQTPGRLGEGVRGVSILFGTNTNHSKNKRHETLPVFSEPQACVMSPRGKQLPFFCCSRPQQDLPTAPCEATLNPSGFVEQLNRCSSRAMRRGIPKLSAVSLNQLQNTQEQNVHIIKHMSPGMSRAIRYVHQNYQTDNYKIIRKCQA